MSNIEWTDRTWNPLRGCSRVSEGCRNCYAEGVAHRFSGPGLPYEGLTTVKGRWNGQVMEVPHKLSEPLNWRKPGRVFVNSMSDLFHEGASDEYIAAVFGVMAACPQHTFQVLTKRPERAREWLGSIGADEEGLQDCCWEATNALGRSSLDPIGVGADWPLPNVWLGVSIEDQATANERLPTLLQCPAAVRFVSYEPGLGPVDLREYLYACEQHPTNNACACMGAERWGLDWVIVGGESGRAARPFDVAWGRSVVQQCAAAGVPVFVKQLGSAPFRRGDGIAENIDFRLLLKDRRGADMSEWPADLRVRQFPGVA